MNDLVITETHSCQSVTVSLSGSATAPHIDRAIRTFRGAISIRKKILIDLSNIQVVDARFLGVLLMLRKILKVRGVKLILTGLSPRLENIFRLNGLAFLLSLDRG